MRNKGGFLLFVALIFLSLPSCWETLEDVDPFAFPERIEPGDEVQLHLTGTSDTVVFEFSITNFRTVEFTAYDVPNLARVRVSFFTQSREALDSSDWGNYGESKSVVRLMEPGVYYAVVEISSPIFYSHQSYKVRLRVYEPAS